MRGDSCALQENPAWGSSDPALALHALSTPTLLLSFFSLFLLLLCVLIWSIESWYLGWVSLRGCSLGSTMPEPVRVPPGVLIPT